MFCEEHAFAMVVRRMTRSSSFMKSKHLVLNDNLAVVLAISKGRSSAPHTLRLCRLVCATAPY